jgi:predicted ribosome quality control (RQC) complex YloA/Tae2 family protein
MPNVLKFRDLTNFDLRVLSNELQSINGSRIRKFYQYGDNEFRIKLSVPEKGSMDIVILLPYTIHFTKQTKESPEEPPTFAMTLRKHLENKKIEKAGQLNWDRIFIFEFAEYKLVAEFFGKGNLILMDAGNKIIAASRPEETKVRKIWKGEVYSLPEDRRNQPDSIPEDLLDAAVQEKDREKLHLIAFLSRKINFPPFYWEEVLFRAGVEPLTPLAKCTEKQLSSIARHANDFINEMKDPKPLIYSDGSYSILPLKKKKEGIAVSSSSLSELMDRVYSESSSPEISKKFVEKQDKIERKLLQQRKHLEELIAGVDEKQKAGNSVIENERKINSMVEEYRSMKKENKKADEMEKRLSEIFGSGVKLEKGKIIIEIS